MKASQKTISILCLAILSASMLASCGGAPAQSEQTPVSQLCESSSPEQVSVDTPATKTVADQDGREVKITTEIKKVMGYATLCLLIWGATT